VDRAASARSVASAARTSLSLKAPYYLVTQVRHPLRTGRDEKDALKALDLGKIGTAALVRSSPRLIEVIKLVLSMVVVTPVERPTALLEDIDSGRPPVVVDAEVPSGVAVEDWDTLLSSRDLLSIARETQDLLAPELPDSDRDRAAHEVAEVMKLPADDLLVHLEETRAKLVAELDRKGHGEATASH
jgi:ribosomal protein L30/L7E